MNDFEWPEWVPAGVRERIVSYYARVYDGFDLWTRGDPRGPAFGEEVAILDREGEIVAGRWVFMWAGAGVVITPDGRAVDAFVPGRHGPRAPAEPVATAKSVALNVACTSSAEAIRFRGQGCDWFVAMIDDASSSLAILSDYGSWSYRWSAERLSLTHRIACSWDVDYMTNKLAHEERNVYDQAATEEHFKKLLAEETDLTDEQREDVKRLLEDVDWSTEESAYDGLARIEDPNEVSSSRQSWPLWQEAYEHFRYSPTASYNHLRDAYLPALVEYLRARPSDVVATPLPGVSA